MAPFGLRSAGPFGQVTLDARVEIERNREVAFRELRYQRGRRHYFCERSDVVHRVRVNGRRIGGIAEIAESMQRSFSAIADGDGGAGKSFVLDRALDHLERGLQLRLAAEICATSLMPKAASHVSACGNRSIR